MDSTRRVRRTEIDVAKGFALFLVIFGHIVTMHHTLFRWIFSFHMPAFFFLSGMTFRPEKYPDYMTYIKEKGRKLLIPYFAITFVAFIICMIRPDYRMPVLADGWKHQLLWIFYYTQPQNLYVGQIWFLVALFMAELIALIWLRIFDRKSLLIKCYSLLLLAVIAINIRYVYPYLPFGERLPWKLDSALCASVFVITGYYVNRHNLLERIKPAAVFLIPVCTWLSFFLGPQLSSYVNICDCSYNQAAYYYPAAFLGITALVLTARLCRGLRFWQFVGRNSMPLFAGQTFAIYFLVEMIAKITGVTYIPMENMPGNLASLGLAAATLMLMLAFVFPWQLLKERGENCVPASE